MFEGLSSGCCSVCRPFDWTSLMKSKRVLRSMYKRGGKERELELIVDMACDSERRGEDCSPQLKSPAECCC